jgi:hypothetical protein
LKSSELDSFFNSKDSSNSALKGMLEIIFHSKINSTNDLIDFLKNYESEPVPLQKNEILKLIPYFVEEGEKFLSRKNFEEKLTTDIHIFITDLFYFSNGYHKNMENIVFGK